MPISQKKSLDKYTKVYIFLSIECCKDDIVCTILYDFCLKMTRNMSFVNSDQIEGDDKISKLYPTNSVIREEQVSHHGVWKRTTTLL